MNALKDGRRNNVSNGKERGGENVTLACGGNVFDELARRPFTSDKAENFTKSPLADGTKNMNSPQLKMKLSLKAEMAHILEDLSYVALDTEYSLVNIPQSRKIWSVRRSWSTGSIGQDNKLR